MAPKKAKAAAAPPAPEDYNKWSIDKLKEKLKELGASTSGSKQSLLDRIKVLAPVIEAKTSAKADEDVKPAKRGAAADEAASADQPAAKRAKAEAKAKVEPAAKARSSKSEESELNELLDAAKYCKWDDVWKVLGEHPDWVDRRPDYRRFTVMHQAAFEGDIDVLKKVIDEFKGDPKLANKDGQTPEQVARAEGNTEAADFLAKAAKGAAKAKAKGKAKAPASTASDKSTKIVEEEPKETVVAHVTGPTDVFFEDGEFSAEYAKSSKSSCQKCKEKIPEGEMRIGKKVKSEKFDGNIVVWNHWKCFLQAGVLPRSTQLIEGFSKLRSEDQKEIRKSIPDEGGAGKRANAALDKQTKEVFKIQDALAKLSEPQLKDLLKENGMPCQKLGNGAASLLELCADGVCFGTPGRCPVCTDGALILSGEGYRCRGWVSEYLKCTYKTQTPERTECELTDAAKSALGDIKLKTRDRIFAAPLLDKEEEGGASGSSSSEKRPPFLGLTIVTLGRNANKLGELIKHNGGAIADAITKATTFVVAASQEAAESIDGKGVESAKEMRIPGVAEEFIKSCVDAGEFQDMTPHLLWGEAFRLKGIEEVVTTKLVEKDGVSIDSDVGDLIKTTHVLVDRNAKLVYSEMLNKTDVISGGNSFYILHLLESDESEGTERSYWVFRKWGRIGVSQGGKITEEHGTSKDLAIKSFKKQYLEKTGNDFGSGEEFEKKKGLFSRVDVEHKALSAKKAKTEGGGEGDASGSSDQPLGKLSKAQIEKGDAVLDKVNELLKKTAGDESAITKANNKAQFAELSTMYYEYIPHNFGTKKPPIINNEELLGSEKALLQFYLRMGFEEMGGEKEDKLGPIDGVMKIELPESLQKASAGLCQVSDVKLCVTKGNMMHKKKAGAPTKIMTPDLYGAILLYTSNAIYKELNKALRDEDRGVVKKYFPYLRMLFEACARLPTRKQTLWRGVGVDLYSQYKVGSTIIWWGVSSCTSDQQVAQNFMEGCGAGATLLTVETETACDISQVSFYQNEAESILLPGTQLKVISSAKVGQKSKISLREVGRVVG